MSIQLMKPEEQKYTYTQSRQLISQTGCIGHLRADLGSGQEFYSNWDDHYGELKTPEFKRELDEVINTLRFGPLYVDKHNCIIQDGDMLRFDDGQLEQIWTLETGAKGYSAMNPDYMRNHPDAEEKYTPLIADISVTGLRKLHHAEIEGIINPDSRKNDAAYGAILSDRKLLFDFCHANESAGFGNDREWGIRVNTKEYSYLMRLNPNRGEYSLYCYCYRRDWLTQHMKQAEHGIRFITPHYKEIFRLKDGDQIRIITDDGEKRDRTARYIDDYHVEIGSSLYHICEFAERMEELGRKVIPLRSSLPEKCFVYVESTDEIGIVERGEMGYWPAGVVPDKGVSKRQGVDYLNDAQGITKAQATAMKAGSLCGWDTKAADPASYNEQGELQKPQHMDRGEAR
jgi:hypothetical protein